MIQTAENPIASFFSALRPRRVRTFAEFAEQEIILPEGPYEGLPFRCDVLPWCRDVFAVFDGMRYRYFFLSGPRQGGKTLIGFVIPIMYHLFEVGETVIMGVPKIEMAQGIYEQRLLPAIRRSRYAEYIPRRGPGSRGGKVKDFIQYTNGVFLRFMGAGGGDEQRSSHTARVVVLTEIDTMDRAGVGSRQSDPVTQIIGCTASFGARARVYAECITTTKDGRIFQEITEYGTDTKCAMRCPHCADYIIPERENFGGWQGAKDVIEARDNAAFACPACGVIWTEADRLDALKCPVLVSKGQEIALGGIAEGEPPRTHTFGFRWNTMHSSLVTMGDLAEWEYRADKSDNPDDMKALFQFRWTLPYAEDLVMGLSNISFEGILGKIGELGRGIAPKDSEKLVVAIDLGLHYCWWGAMAYMNAEGFLIDYGALEVPQGRQNELAQVLTALRAFRAEVLETGWVREDGKPMIPDVVVVDSGGGTRAGEAFKDVAYPFVRESNGAETLYFPSKGLGTARNQDGWRRPNPGRGRIIGTEWVLARQDRVRLLEMNTDHWKAEVHRGFETPAGNPGSINLFNADKKDHWKYAKHIIAEKQEQEFIPGKGLRVYWRLLNPQNHYLDVTYMALVGGALLGIKTIDSEESKEGEGYAEQKDDGYKESSDSGWTIGR
jgi:phage terminase large subunit GpA-like protein